MRVRPAAATDQWDWQKLARVAHRETQRVLANPHDAEDAAQNAMIRAYRARDRCLTPTARDAWIRAIARREAMRVATSSAHREQPVDVLPEEDEKDCMEPVLDSLSARAILAHVPVGDRGLLVRRYVLEQTSSEIAADLAVPPATVRVRLHRAVKRLQEHDDLSPRASRAP
jgi:RNA polymerase sigma-70 factor (ECF subfamily)